MFRHVARGEPLAGRNRTRIRSNVEARGIGRRDKRGAHAVPGTVAAGVICVARGFIALMRRHPVIAAVVRMCRRRLVISGVKNDRHRRSCAKWNERNQQKHDQSLEQAKHAQIMTCLRRIRSIS